MAKVHHCPACGGTVVVNPTKLDYTEQQVKNGMGILQTEEIGKTNTSDERHAVTASWYKAWQYQQDHPDIFRFFCDFTAEAIDRGAEHLGSMDIIGRVRWETRVEKIGEYKVKNDMHPYYARLFMHLFPQHKGFFIVKDKPLGL